jgi:DNA-directed RNA polymerase subunit RPC12/RpoP
MAEELRDLQERTWERRRSNCPHCQDQRGEAKGVAHATDSRTLSYECPSCGHRWDIQRPWPEPETLP